jgi:hypothetical protein
MCNFSSTRCSIVCSQCKHYVSRDEIHGYCEVRILRDWDGYGKAMDVKEIRFPDEPACYKFEALEPYPVQLEIPSSI